MTRRRILAALIGVTLLTLVALFLPSLHRSPQRTAEPSQAAAPQAAVSLDATASASDSRANSAPPAVPAPALATEAAPPASAPQSVVPPQDVDPHKAFGSKTAPVIMEIFSDYQCPSCRAFYLTTNRQLMDNYVSAGKVYLIHRDFPLSMHAYSRVAARYARAAAQIGKVEAVEQALYENQEKWEQTGDVDGTVAGALSAAEMNKVRALVKGGTLDALIDKDFAQGQMYRINQTPTTIFHAKGQTYPFAGVMTNDTLKTFLDQLLSQR